MSEVVAKTKKIARKSPAKQVRLWVRAKFVGFRRSKVQQNTNQAILRLVSQVDSVAGERGFKRSSKSLTYRRKTEELVQTIAVHVQRPNSYPSHQAVITAHVCCESQLVGERTLKLLRGRKDTVGNHPNLLFNLNIGLWRKQPNGIIWEPCDSQSWELFGRELADLLTQVAFSVFDRFSRN